VHGAGFVSTHTASAVKAGQPVELIKSTNSLLPGVVLAVQKALALDESEIVIGISNATAALKAGEFVPARINLPRDQAVLAIPQAAVLRTSEGTFVYAVNGDAYFRTAVKVGAEADGWVEITNGRCPATGRDPARANLLSNSRAKGGGTTLLCQPPH
jgi:multidrug efflux pump subunit AcrA (membrane-fusion protein)